MAQPFIPIRTEGIVNEQGQPREPICQRLSSRARCYDILQRPTESSKLAPKHTPALFEKLDCTRRSTLMKTRRECAHCERRREVFEDDEIMMLRQ